MAVILIEGFDHENGMADLQGGQQPIISVCTGWPNGQPLNSVGTRWGAGNMLQLNPGGASGGAFQAGRCVFPLYQNLGAGTVGIAFKGIPAGTTNDLMGFGLFDQTSGNTQIGIGFTSGNMPVIYRGSLILFNDGVHPMPVVLWTGSNPISLTDWNYLEFTANIGSGTAGSISFRLNGAPIFTLTGIDSQCSTNPWFNAVVVEAELGGGGWEIDIDDLYVTDTTGSAPANGFLGDVRVQTLFPTANDAVQWTPLTGANWQEVSEVAMDGDTSYNFSNVLGSQDTFAHQALLGVPIDIFAAQVTVAARIDDATGHTLAPVCKSGSTVALGSALPVASGYGYIKGIFPTNPSGGGAWSAAAVNAAPAGYNLVS